MGILTHLTEEHAWIQEVLNVVRHELASLASREQILSAQLEGLEDLLKSLDFFVHEIHHEKEERILFPSLDLNPRLKEGGPRCTYFFKYVMEKTHVAEIIAATKSSDTVFIDTQRKPFVRDMFKKNSPLAIPLQEHEYGQLATAEIRRMVVGVKTGIDTDVTKLISLYESYFQLMDLHIRKENECLFMLANELLAPEEQSKLYDQARDFEAKIGIDEINRHREVILRHS